MLTILEYKKRFPHSWSHRESRGLKNPFKTRIIREGYLLFNEDSAYCWAPPFDGNFAFFYIEDYTDAVYFDGSSFLAARAREEQKRKEKAFRDGEQFYKWMEDPSYEFPVKFYMCGDDDVSYTKCYASEAAALKELEFFLANEPLDISIIKDFSFIFTN